DRSAPAAAASPAPAESWTGAPAGATPDAAAPPQMPAQPPVDVLTQHPAEPVGLVIALGGNVGGVVPALRAAVRTLRETDGITVTTVAPLARTAAVVEPGSPEQPDYLNTVVLAQTTLSPREVLAVCQGLEADAGRVRTEPKGPRTLDADIITYGGVTSDAADLTLPHPNAARRAFVLAPWAQADPFAEIGDQYVASLVESAPDREGVRWLALDWLDSDHLPALPTGQYVAPPEAGEDQPDQPTGAGASEPGGLDGAAGAPADEGLPADAGPGDPSAGNGQRPAGPVAGAGQTPVASEPDRESGQEPTTHQQTGAPPAGSAPHASSAPRTGTQGEPWSSPLEWNDVIGRNGQGR
ncbi:2-amino-4-hydroxy-6-hydroxymethyldihydropteridine diphosphokinase, partial [uncultured Actinomyces sp.]|uniref:2-amino-4-hydroxy-6- hydroxymethyldihydropteridine diphosphokinase n=1 Tax=uncultured Actinomyces sp. TaxID=249061 RepID=UPI0028E8DA9C